MHVQRLSYVFQICTFEIDLAKKYQIDIETLLFTPKISNTIAWLAP